MNVYAMKTKETDINITKEVDVKKKRTESLPKVVKDCLFLFRDRLENNTVAAGRNLQSM